jgi:hypothetical protein
MRLQEFVIGRAQSVLLYWLTACLVPTASLALPLLWNGMAAELHGRFRTCPSSSNCWRSRR